MKQHRNMATWVFDSHCVLCEGGVHYTLKHEKSASIRFVAIGSTEGRRLAVEHGVNPDDPSTFLFIENGLALGKSDAVIALSRHLNGPARMVPWMRILPRRVRDAAYGVIARHRYRLFGKNDLCLLPSAENQHRFVLK